MTDPRNDCLAMQLQAMRAARDEDAKTCARLTARVKELERRESAVRDILLTVHASHLAPHGALGKIASVVGFDPDTWSRYRSSQEAPILAEGTRDETATRCQLCKVPCAVTSQHGLCGMCEEQRKCRCPPGVFMPTSLGSRRCSTCGGARGT